MSKQEKMQDLLNEGENLLESFNKKGNNEKHFTDSEPDVIEWITKSLREIEISERKGSDSPTYKEFAKFLNEVELLSLDKFKNLMAILRGVKKTLPEEMDWSQLNN